MRCQNHMTTGERLFWNGLYNETWTTNPRKALNFSTQKEAESQQINTYSATKVMQLTSAQHMVKLGSNSIDLLKG